MNIFSFSVGSEAKRVAVRCVFAIGVVCWANCIIPKFVAAEEENLSHAEKQRVWSRSCGLQELLQYIVIVILCDYCKQSF